VRRSVSIARRSARPRGAVTTKNGWWPTSSSWPGTIARVADDESVRERQAEETARQRQRDQERLDDPFGKFPIRGNGRVKPAAQGREPVAGAAA
jgi:hypothetical protein